MIEKKEFLQKYKITEEQFEAAQIKWDVLEKIYEDYKNKRKDEYDKLGKELSNNSPDTALFYPKPVGLHSFYWRVKEPEHLIAKIIRKRRERYDKYKDINEENYWMIVRDLLGFRGLLVFREDWPEVHKYIISRYTDDRRLYIDDSNLDTYNVGKDNYLAEPTIAHVRDGDDKSIYKSYLGDVNIINKQNLRSVHYIIKCKDLCFELQLRTLFEEALGEMDHKIRYPINISDGTLTLFADIMNHLVGAVDELGSFYLRLYNGNVIIDTNTHDTKSDIEILKNRLSASHKNEVILNMDTPSNCLENIIKN